MNGFVNMPIKCIFFDASLWQSRYTFFDEMFDRLNVGEPSHNLDSFADSLVELEIPYESGSVLVFRRFDHFAEQDHTFAQGLLDVIENASRLFILHSYRFLALIQVGNPHIAFEPVGARPVILNPIEYSRRFHDQIILAKERKT